MSFLSSRWTPFIVLALGLVCTAVAARELIGAARERDQQRFENVARRLETSLTHRLEADITLLRATAGLMYKSDGFGGPAEFHAFLDAFKPEQRPGVRAVGYSRQIQQSEVP